MIKNVVIVGMGALGIMYGDHIQSNSVGVDVCFLMDEKRRDRHSADEYVVNGAKKEFVMKTPKECAKADLVIMATKFSGLNDGLKLVEDIVDEDTIFMSVLNGISSEGYIADMYSDKRLVYTVALGMDAMREGGNVHYTKMGRLQIGAVKEYQESAVDEVAGFFDSIHMPYERVENIIKAMWSKFLINVGINQTCMVYDTCYKYALSVPEYKDMMSKAMHEVIEISKLEGVNLSEEDYTNAISILSTLHPDGYPSMRQDALGKRKSEVELFAGTMLMLAKKHGVEVCANQFFYDRIMEIESAY